MKKFDTLRDLIREVRANFGSLTAILRKDRDSGKYEALSYETLCGDAKRVGRVLCSLGLIGKKIIICGENGYEWVTAYLAVTGYCGTAVPLSRSLAPEELKAAAEHCDASAIIYGDGCEALADALPDTCVKLSFSELKSLKYNGGAPKYEPKDSDVAELAYSSGTEGRSRAVLLTHKNICHSIAAVSERITLGETDRAYSVLPLTHLDERIFGLLFPLASGASVAYGDGLRKMTANMRETRPTMLLCVPFILDKLYSKIKKNIKEKNKLDAVRRVIKLTDKAGSFKKPLRKKIFAQIHESLGGKLRFFFTVGDGARYKTLRGLSAFGFDTVQGYGLTETAGLVSISTDPDDHSSVGRPIESGLVDIYNIQSDGVGEIRYMGDNVTPGYYKDSAETAEHLRGGWLYTGDMGYIDGVGSLRIVGRKGNIIATSKGKQIYPEELEARLIRCAFIKECAVVGVPNAISGEYDTVAVIYPDKARFTDVYGAGYTEATVLHELEAAVETVNEQLEKTYKHITRFTVTDSEFARTADGKIIRGLIPKNV